MSQPDNSTDVTLKPDEVAPLDSTNQPTAIVPVTPSSAERSTMGASDTPVSGPLLPTRVFGAYDLLQELGRGGMGVVFKARHRELNRLVAIKMVLASHLANQDDLQRFRAEAEAAAQLRHPHIVAVHDVGVVEGQHYYSMEYIEGPSLSRRLAEGSIPDRTAARYVMLIARGVQHAHLRGILHRDLKPSNVLLDAEDRPHIADFGLAKKLDSVGQTQTGSILGTPSYMAPEQALGRKDLSPACDIYSLGAVLYELLTGHPVFAAPTPMETLHQVVEREPVPPAHLNPRIDPDLATICLKCLQKEPHARYPSAEALAEDLDRYLRGEPITARNFTVLDRLARTLDHSGLEIEFRSWATMLNVFALFMCLGFFAQFAMAFFQWGRSWIWPLRGMQFTALALTFWHFRLRKGWLPRSPAERQLWTIWLGYFLGLSISGGVVRLLAGQELWDERAVYPFAAVLAGMGFFVMGSNFWGRFYLIGLAFFALAALMPLALPAAPLALGVLWSVTLHLLSRHFRHLSA